MKILSKLGIVCATLAAGLQFAVTPARADLMAYEGFNYTNNNGTKLNAIAVQGGVGWTGNWGETPLIQSPMLSDVSRAFMVWL